MRFWLQVIAVYLLAILIGVLTAVLLALWGTSIVFKPEDGDNPAAGFYWILLSSALWWVITPFFLGLGAEWLQSRVYSRSFKPGYFLRRVLIALLIPSAPLYSAYLLLLQRPDTWTVSRWLQDTVLWFVALPAAYFALRIRRPFAAHQVEG